METKYSDTVFQCSFDVFVLYLTIAILCYVTCLLNYSSEENIGTIYSTVFIWKLFFIQNTFKIKYIDQYT